MVITLTALLDFLKMSLLSPIIRQERIWRKTPLSLIEIIYFELTEKIKGLFDLTCPIFIGNDR